MHDEMIYTITNFIQEHNKVLTKNNEDISFLQGINSSDYYKIFGSHIYGLEVSNVLSDEIKTPTNKAIQELEKRNILIMNHIIELERLLHLISEEIQNENATVANLKK